MKEVLTSFLTKLKTYDSLAIIGLSKNIGKTTTMNAILKLLDYQNVSLTSIGYDGEDSDLVFGTYKPNILIKEGMIVATAKKCVLESEVPFLIMDTTGFNTPLGEIIIVKALGDGLVKLAGPSYNAQLRAVIKKLHEFGGGQVIVDGALNRKTFSDPSVCDATILCSGMTLSDSIDEVVQITNFTLDLLQTPLIQEDVDLLRSIQVPIAIVDQQNDILEIEVKTSINSESLIVHELTPEAKYLVINGPLTDKLAQAIIKNRKRFNNLTLVLKNGTNIFIKEKTLQQLRLAKIDLKVLDYIKVEAIAMNPNSLYKQFDSETLVNKMREKTDVFVYDFVKGGN